MNGINGIILDGKVYEISIYTAADVCEECAFENGNGCDAPYWLNCNCIAFHYSQTLTDKLKSQ